MLPICSILLLCFKKTNVKNLFFIITILYLEGFVLATLVVHRHVHWWFVHLATFRGLNATA